VPAFVDTSHWIARVMPRDRRHRAATDLSAATASKRLVTSNLVVGETWTFLRSRASHRLALTWLDVIAGGMELEVVRVDEELEAEAWAWLRVHDERPYSFVDATSFALMRKRGITEALAFDGDFAAAGFTELTA